MPRKSVTSQRMQRPWRGGQGGAGRGDGGGSQGNPLGERVDRLLELWIFLKEGLELGDGVDDRRVVLAAEGAPYVAE